MGTAWSRLAQSCLKHDHWTKGVCAAGCDTIYVLYKRGSICWTAPPEVAPHLVVHERFVIVQSRSRSLDIHASSSRSDGRSTSYLRRDFLSTL